MASDFNDALDEINFAEHRRHRQIGFTRGYSVGEEAGWRDGYVFGVKKGAQIAAEIGFYQGFVHAWICILEREDGTKQKKLTALRTLLEMTRNYPKINLQDDESIQKLARIRAKFKQINALLNCESGASFRGYSGFSGSSWASQDSGAGTYSGTTYSATGSVRGTSPRGTPTPTSTELSF